MRQSTRLIVNTLITYTRMAITVGLGLAVTRLALQTLGDSDFGLLTTLGASGILLLVLSDALTASTQRHLAYEIGREDQNALRTVFNTALVIYASLAVIAGATGLALWPVIQSLIDVPDGREAAAGWVFLLTLASIVITILATPYRGFLIARQSFWAIAVYDLSQALLGFGAVLLLMQTEGDQLITYAWLLLGVRVAAEGLIIAVASLVFPDCRPRPWLFRRDQIKRIASFAGWSLLVLTAWRLRVQGSIILLNSYYGSSVSAAYGVATQIGGYQNQIGAAVWRAVRPAMATIEAKGGAQGVRDLTLVSSKYLFLLTLFFLIPAELEMVGVLDLWLDKVPPYSVSLTRLVLLWTAMNWASMGYQMAMEAKGTLGRYALLMCTFDAAVLFIQIVVLAVIPALDNGRPVVDPWIAPAISVIVLAAQNVCRAWYVGRILGVSLSRWVTEVLWPCALVAAIGGSAALAPFLLLPDTPWRILATLAVYGVVALPVIWFLAMRAWEREHFVRVATGALTLSRQALRVGRGTVLTTDAPEVADLDPTRRSP